MKSTYAGELTVDAAQIVVNEITLVGSRCGPFEPALSALAAGTVIVDDLIESRYMLSDVLAAFEHAARRGSRKILIDIATDGRLLDQA
jgi:threonine dehydrogenase-like Zn-dependent dehydrogenase